MLDLLTFTILTLTSICSRHRSRSLLSKEKERGCGSNLHLCALYLLQGMVRLIHEHHR
uniref:Uncharacterized protein n=1 Tax=Solanum tuberosum TaxID=4113 RepID=M1C178_SOLTU